MVNGTGAVFKLLHFPGANYLIISSLLIIGLLFIPIYFTHSFRLAENKLSNLAFAGVLLVALFLLYGLTNSGNTKVMSQSVYIMHQSLLNEIDRAEEERKEVFSGLNQAELASQTEELLAYLTEFRTQSIMASQHVPRDQAENMNIRDMYWGTGVKDLRAMLEYSDKYNAAELRSRLKAWQESAGVQNNWLCCASVVTPEGELSWEKAHFGHSTTVLSLVSFLDQLRLEVNQKSLQIAWRNQPAPAAQEIVEEEVS